MSVLDRSTPPASGSLRDFSFPAVDRKELANGLDLRVARMNRLPMVNVSLFMRASEDALSSDRAGLAVLTADALEGGTKKRSGSELAESLERIGARVSASAGWEGTTVGISCLADRLPEAFAIMAEAVREPSFPEGEVRRALDQQLATIRQRQMDPGALATDSARAAYFAPDVPYVRAVDGTVASIEAMSRDTLRGYVEANYRPEGGGLVVVGDVEVDEVAEMVMTHFGDWTGSPSHVADFEVEPATTFRRVILVHRPGAVQSEVRIGHVGTSRSTPDYYPLSIANMVLGGMFTSRLNLNLREENGFTYGVRSRFTFRSSPGPFQISTAVGNDVTAPAVREAMSELTKMAEAGPTEDEVSAARDYAAGVFGLQLETSGQVATRVNQLLIYGLADDHYDRYRDDVRAVTADAAKAAAATHMRPMEAQIVVVGDAEVIGQPLEELALAPVQVVGAD
jgi:zinc protease